MSKRKDWSSDEDDYLNSLIELNKLKAEEMTYLINSRFNTTRTVSSVNSRISKVKIILRAEIPTEVLDKVASERVTTRIKPPNSGKSWTPADDKTLMENWTAYDDRQSTVSEQLGRTVIACMSRMGVLRKDPRHQRYFDSMVQSIVPQGNIVLPTKDTVGKLMIDDRTPRLNVDVSYLLVETRPQDYTFIDRIYHWWKTRKIAKSAKKDMRRMDKENRMWKKEEELNRRNEMQKQIKMLQNKIKELGV